MPSERKKDTESPQSSAMVLLAPSQASRRSLGVAQSEVHSLDGVGVASRPNQAASNIKVVTLTVSPGKLRAIFPSPIPSQQPGRENDSIKVGTGSKDKKGRVSEVVPAPLPSDSVSSEKVTAAPDTSSAAQALAGNMAISRATAVEDGGPAVKKKGVKRSATTAGVDGAASPGPASTNGDTPIPAARVRSKPGPKKKAKLEDGVEIRAPAAAAHKLGPKASMGAINAGLRALDRTGKPCRKWVKGGFQLKSFTGVCWSIPRWRAPPKLVVSSFDSANGTGEESASGATPSADSTGSINKNKGVGRHGQTNGVNGVNGLQSSPSDVDVTATSAVASPSVEPVTAAATPIAAAT
ncbi:hypothetical protein SEPCBS57363_001597 [Sporothrix epigloea]|uniref:Duf1711 domain containing protein n=1 Tax=Sporothrix epigloea TaxID=1892477 RepID=A0ABP0DE97_9PEZI